MSQNPYIRLFSFTVSQWFILFCTWLFHSSEIWVFFLSRLWSLIFWLSIFYHSLQKKQPSNRNRRPTTRRQWESKSPRTSCSYMLCSKNPRAICQACLICRYLTEQWTTRSPLKTIIWKTTEAGSLLGRILKKAWSKIVYGKMVE